MTPRVITHLASKSATTHIIYMCIVAALLLAATPARAQRDSVVVRERHHNPNYERPVFRGFSAHLDLLTPCLNLVYGQVYGGEVHADINLMNRLFPTVEVGYGDAGRTLSSTNHYHASSTYVRVGLNYGLLKPFNKRGEHRSLDCYPYIGVRYAMSFASYSITGITATSDYWGSHTEASYGQPFAYIGWIEILAGVRMNLYRGLTMGWSFRFRTGVHTTAPDKAYIWYAPGYGKTDGSAFTFNYTIGYTYKTRAVREIEPLGL